MKWFLPLLAAFLLVGCTAQPSGESSESASEPGNSLEYHMQTAPQPDCPFLFAEENTPIYGIPFDSPENGTISNQLVQVFANVYGGECPDCGESGPWALINWGIFDSAVDTTCWVCTCHLRPYTAEDAEIITYPVKVRDGVAVTIREKETPSADLSEARVSSRTDAEITLNWVGGDSCTLPLSDVLVPDPELVGQMKTDPADWKALFAP